MESHSPRQLSTTEIDLESVLQVRRRQVSVNQMPSSIENHRHVDVIFLKVQRSIDITKEDARCIFHGDYHVIIDIFQKFTSSIKIHHADPDSIRNHDRLSGKLYITIELPTMSLIEILEILQKHHFNIVANSANFGSTTKQEEFILIRCRDTHDLFRSTSTIDNKIH